MQYTISQIASVCGVNIPPSADAQSGLSTLPKPESIVRHLLIDSRKLGFAPDALFIALTGPRHDGHFYVADLYARGVRNFMVSKLPETSMPDANVLVVEDTLDMLQKLAATHRAGFSYPVVGITGSNGKTVVKEWLFQLLSPELCISRSPRSYNSQVGVPLSVFMLHEHTELALIEAGISLPGEMEKLQEIIKPTIGVLTNIGSAHDEGFETRTQKLNEKLKLFSDSEALIYCADDPVLGIEVPGYFTNKGPELLAWSLKDKKAPLYISQTREQGNGLLIIYRWNGQFAECSIPFKDMASKENAIHCLAVMLHLGVAFKSISTRMSHLETVAMRMELKQGQNGCLLVNDAYSADLASLRIALDFLVSRQKRKRNTIILSDILQSGLDQEILYNQVAGLLEEFGMDRLIAVGDRISANRHLFEHRIADCRFFKSTGELISKMSPKDFSDERVLIKGARRFEFEQISRMLELQGHGTVLEISLDALVHNLNVYKKIIGENVKIMAMVKAFAYGSGYVQVARALAFNRVDYLAVAYADEGVFLRKAGIEIPIMVMSPEVDSLAVIKRYNLEPELHSFELLDAFLGHLQTTDDSSHSIPIHLKLDTGMHRLGFGPGDCPVLIQKLKKDSLGGRLHIASVFTHLAAAEDAGEDEFTLTQLRLFNEMCEQLCNAPELQPKLRDGKAPAPILKHVLNSAGIVRFAAHRYDMVRLGIGLYGIDPSQTIQEQLKQPGRLVTHIAQIREVAAGQSIGYNRKGRADQPMKIATLNIGYADGLRRSLGNGKGQLYVNGHKVPVVGNVCMDLCMVDVSEIAELCAGDEVEVFGNHITLSEYAESLETIPYEALTGVSSRVKRVYVQE